MRVHGRRALILAVVLGTAPACSTVDRGPIDDCQDDADCGTGLVCSYGETNICVPESLPPLSVLGFDIRDGNLVRVELSGCDPEVDRELGGSSLRIQARGSLVRAFMIDAATRREVTGCDANECAGDCNELTLTCTEPSDAQLDLSMASRLSLSDLTSMAMPYLSMPGEDLTPTPASFDWPKYESDSDAAHPALRLQVSPIAPAVESKLGRYVQVIPDGVEGELTTTAASKCQRAIIGPEGTVRTVGGTPIDDVAVEFSYDEPIATRSTVLGTAPSCADEEPRCAIGWACNEDTNTCGLDLTGMLAGSALRPDPPGSGGVLPHTYLYTYCEHLEDGETLTRQFQVRLTPPTDSGLPTLTYALEQEFPDVPLAEVNIDGALCLPDWQAPQQVAFSVTGEPVTLTETNLGEYTCCSTECLPSPEPDIVPTPPPATPDSCANFERVRFETRWRLDENEVMTWQFAGCIDPGLNADGSNGRYVRDGVCGDEGCSVSLTLGDVGDLSRPYTVTIIQPTGSVFRTQRFQLSLTSEMTELPTFAMRPRVLLRGQIVCKADETNCNAQKAVFAAERLRTDDDDADWPGPYYFEARADLDGNFVLPIDPGLYVVTAFPELGQPGGPARFSILDLREDSPLVTEVGGVPHAVIDGPIELDDGVLVRVQLRDFPVSTAVLPLDLGSWKYQNDFPADEYDLNLPGTCLGSSSRGCDIRRIRPTSAPLTLQLNGRIQFTARDRGESACG